jgi:hypothetical protein
VQHGGVAMCGLLGGASAKPPTPLRNALPSSG